MKIPVQISFRNTDRSEAVEAKVRERAEGLDKYFGHITSCRVMIEAPERRRHQGKLFHVRVELGVPGKELVANRHPAEHHAHEDVYVAVRDAFDAARRQLEDYARKLSGRVKTHDVPLHGKVLRLFPNEGYGFIEASDGQEIYFHGNSIVGASFDDLDVGSDVRLEVAEGESDKGSQASTVRLIGKHHIVP
ncbi:MAG: HPF/RaiA family ribosome-associated protein [Alphaproteobacteria bacterium]|nr:HPF/RaiA family ribosome-associated protein [Alphaproteobacteria bacterium]